ncbi:MAG: hypothetical protein ACOC0P_05030, partial [Planctomycetota bacterium]
MYDGEGTMLRRPIVLAVTLMTQRFSLTFWRLTFVLYAVALTIGTHLPTFRPPGQQVLPVDKILHLIAFAGLAGLLMLTRW